MEATTAGSIERWPPKIVWKMPVDFVVGLQSSSSLKFFHSLGADYIDVVPSQSARFGTFDHCPFFS
jgi:hypothetical protein